MHDSHVSVPYETDTVHGAVVLDAGSVSLTPLVGPVILLAETGWIAGRTIGYSERRASRILADLDTICMNLQRTLGDDNATRKRHRVLVEVQYARLLAAALDGNRLASISALGMNGSKTSHRCQGYGKLRRVNSPWSIGGGKFVHMGNDRI
jgi:hypothetical protein